MHYECISCGETFPVSRRLYTCPECDSLLEIELDLEKVKDEIDKDALKNEYMRKGKK